MRVLDREDTPAERQRVARRLHQSTELRHAYAFFRALGADLRAGDSEPLRPRSGTDLTGADLTD